MLICGEVGMLGYAVYRPAPMMIALACFGIVVSGMTGMYPR